MSKRHYLKSMALAAIALLASGSAIAQGKPDRPRIVVGMVVDQMCWDYLMRYNARFGKGGFRRLLTSGFNCHNTRLPYIPSVTAIGHSSVYTGSVPSIHGIAGNNFYIDGGEYVYCTEDLSVEPVGVPSRKDLKMSPKNLLATTITDELKMATNFRSKVIGVSLKDRGAILPAGHAADAAYWLDDKSGNFITSTFYRKDLPQWLVKFNDQKLVERYLKQDWKPLYDLKTYTESCEDDNNYEGVFVKGARPVFPVKMSEMIKDPKIGLGVIRSVPYGNTVTLDLARAAIEGESLGSRAAETDFLAISLSSTDYVGHRFGVNAVETEDTYLRLDKDLASFFTYLDKRFGKDGYLFFITADHAAAHNIGFMLDHKLPAGAFLSGQASRYADSVARRVLGTDVHVVKSVNNYQVVFNQARLDSLGADKEMLYDKVAEALTHFDGVAYAVNADKAATAAIPEEIRYRIINGYNMHRSGKVFIIPQPGWWLARGNDAKGTQHGVWPPYDTHIPLIFMGHRIKPGHLYRETFMTDISATLAFLLSTQLPSGCIGKPITEILQ